MEIRIAGFIVLKCLENFRVMLDPVATAGKWKPEKRSHEKQGRDGVQGIIKKLERG